MRRAGLTATLIALLSVLLLAISCGSSEQQGTITVSGAWALYPMMVRWADEYAKLHPGIKFDVSAGGAGKGMADALAGVVDIGMVSRAVTPEEEQRGAFWVPVAKDAVFLTVNASNPVWEDLHRRGVTRDTLIGIYITGKVTNWGQVVERPEVTDPIHVFTRSDAAGAPETWAKYLGKTQEDLLGVRVYGDPGLLDAVVKDRLGIGYNNLGFVFDPGTGQPVAGARVVPLDVNANGQADPEELCDSRAQAQQAVALGHYPSPPARDENLVTKGKPQGVIKAFIVWILTDGQKYLDEAGYIGLPKETLEAALNKLN